MTYAVSASQMREFERNAMEKFNIPGLILMENAAMRTVPYVLRFFNGEKSTRGNEKNTVVVCGPGNNGGDGFAIARQLHAAGADVTVITTGEPGTGDARANFEIVKRLGISIYKYPAAHMDSGAEDTLANLLRGADVTVDALFGTGLARPVTGVPRELVEMINTHAKHVVSVDIPSGLNADTGQPMGAAVKADITVTYGYAKTGLLIYPGAEYAGEVFVEGISVPTAGNNGFGKAPVHVLNDSDIPALMPVRKPNSNKGSHGRVCVLAGSAAMPGAAVLACTAAYRMGAGLVDACVIQEVADVIHGQLPEAVTTIITSSKTSEKNWERAVADSISKATVVLLGPGLGQDILFNEVSVNDFVRFVLENANAPIVLDADGLNAAAAMGTDCLKAFASNRSCIITPHPGEMSRLTGLSVPEILADPLETARKFARDHGVTVLLKGARTVIAAPDGSSYINISGSAALAKAGSGDVLSGIIAGLVAQSNMQSTSADAETEPSLRAQSEECASMAALGAFLHGRAGERAAEKLSVYGVNARDVTSVLF